MKPRLCLLLVVLAAAGATTAYLLLREEASRAPRPGPGDTVHLELEGVGQWKAGAKAYLTLRLRVHGPSLGDAELLRNREVPEDFAPDIHVTFFRDDDELTAPARLIVERCC